MFNRRRRMTLVVLLGCAAMLISGGCAMNEHIAQWEDVTGGVAVVHPASGSNCRGVVRFIDVPDGVRVVADIEGLEPNGTHAFHVHEYGDCTAPDAASAGSHYDPEHTGWHDRPNVEKPHHAGDLGNLVADANGKAHYDMVIHDVTVAGLENPLIGRSVIIHTLADQFDQPTGSAGGRIGCGIIGVANPATVGGLPR